MYDNDSFFDFSDYILNDDYRKDIDHIIDFCDGTNPLINFKNWINSEFDDTMFWIKHNLGFQLEDYKNKYVKLTHQVGANKFVVEIMYIKSIDSIEREKVIIHTDQHAIFLYIDNYIDHADIFTKSPKSTYDSTVEVSLKEFKYTIKELTRTEYDDWLFKALNVNLKYEIENEN